MEGGSPLRLALRREGAGEGGEVHQQLRQGRRPVRVHGCLDSLFRLLERVFDPLNRVAAPVLRIVPVALRTPLAAGRTPEVRPERLERIVLAGGLTQT